MKTRLKILNWCDRILDSQLDHLQKVIWQIKKGKAQVSVARLKMKMERKEKDVYCDPGKASGVTKSNTLH